VNTTLKTVGLNLLEGALLVTLVLFIFLLDLRAALLVAVLIPLSLANHIDGWSRGIEGWGHWQVRPRWRLSGGFLTQDKELWFNRTTA
jgi:hypothetical protein